MAKMPAAPSCPSCLVRPCVSVARLGGRRVLHWRRRMDAGPDSPLVAAAVAAARHRPRHRGWYVWRYSRAERDADGRWLHRWVARALPFAVPLAVVLAVYLGVHYGSFAAAGSDSYGYVSQARLWLSGIPRVEQPWVQDFPWPNREWMFAPLGYRPFSPDGTIVPTYPAGLPMIMAVFLARPRRERTVLRRARAGGAAWCGSRTCSAEKRPAAEP